MLTGKHDSLWGSWDSFFWIPNATGWSPWRRIGKRAGNCWQEEIPMQVFLAGCNCKITPTTQRLPPPGWVFQWKGNPSTFSRMPCLCRSAGNPVKQGSTSVEQSRTLQESQLPVNICIRMNYHWQLIPTKFETNVLLQWNPWEIQGKRQKTKSHSGGFHMLLDAWLPYTPPLNWTLDESRGDFGGSCSLRNMQGFPR